MRGASFAVAAATLVLVSGCGGDGKGDKEKIESTVHSYFEAFAEGDSGRACAQLVPEVADELAKAARQKTCSDAIARALERPDVKRYQPDFRNVKVLSVEIGGDKATVKVRAIGTTTSVPLRKEGKSWKIEGRVGGTR